MATAQTYAASVCREKSRSRWSSIMRWRNGVIVGSFR
jgi:hypothetical protein